MEEWARASGGRIRLHRSGNEKESEFRFLWVEPRHKGYFGETRPSRIHGKRGAVLHIIPGTRHLSPEIATSAEQDPLFRDTIVYLTCLHEAGHAFGIPHSKDYGDVMYAFAYGGDIKEYFLRYRRKLRTRGDLRRANMLSARDWEALRSALDRGP
jgi:hypothetical protein